MSQLVYNDIHVIEGGITEPEGFWAAGAHIGIKKKKKDLSLIRSEAPATAAGVFTQNIVKASCVVRNQKLISNKINGIVINSGVANACTGETGARNNEVMAQIYAECLGVSNDTILTASTGVIGSQLPMDILISGIKTVYKSLGRSEENAKKAAKGIMTTDTFVKEIAIQTEIGGETVKIAGISKGSGMIHPNMATMLAFITTDANISRDLLQKALSEDVDDTYNMISVDGDTSTNDMVIVLANGKANNPEITSENEDYQKFKKALHYVNMHLAKQIIKDGEGVTKVLEVNVKGAATKQDAKKIAKSIITSNLVKTALFGEDANWGRIICAAGYSGAQFTPEKTKIEFSSKAGTIVPFVCGEPIAFDEEKALKVLKEKEIQIAINLEDGLEKATAWGCDLSYEYVKINGEYRT